MKTLAVFALSLLGLTACVEYGVVRPGPAVVDVLDPSQPVYTSRQFVVATPMPSSPPVGFFQGPRPIAPVGFARPYWVGGYYGWRNNSWQWAPGRWVNRPRANVVWVSGRSFNSGNRHMWRSGYWR